MISVCACIHTWPSHPALTVHTQLTSGVVVNSLSVRDRERDVSRLELWTSLSTRVPEHQPHRTIQASHCTGMYNTSGQFVHHHQSLQTLCPSLCDDSTHTTCASTCRHSTHTHPITVFASVQSLECSILACHGSKGAAPAWLQMSRSSLAHDQLPHGLRPRPAQTPDGSAAPLSRGGRACDPQLRA